MPALDRQQYALQTIFSFFLGLMVTAFIGVGVNTFYPSPDEAYQKQIREIGRRQEHLSTKAAPGSYSAAEQAEMDSIRAVQDALIDRQQAERKDWARTTSIVLVVFATIALVVSLTLNERIRVIANGLLLGGLFTMIYGVGWVIFSGNSVARFFVILFALAVAIGLGYARFVRGRREASVVAPAGSGGRADAAALEALSARLRSIEDRLSGAAAVLTRTEAPGPDTPTRDRGA